MPISPEQLSHDLLARVRQGANHEGIFRIRASSAETEASLRVSELHESRPVVLADALKSIWRASCVFPPSETDKVVTIMQEPMGTVKRCLAMRRVLDGLARRDSLVQMLVLCGELVAMGVYDHRYYAVLLSPVAFGFTIDKHGEELIKEFEGAQAAFEFMLKHRERLFQ